MKKPDGKFKCLVCSSEWDGQQLCIDPSLTAVRLTCGNAFCGGTVVRIKAGETAEFRSLRTALREVQAGDVHPVSELWEGIDEETE